MSWDEGGGEEDLPVTRRTGVDAGTGVIDLAEMRRGLESGRRDRGGG